MAVLSALQPEKVFYYFEEICKIPHPSYHEKEISDYLVGFAKEHNLQWFQDELFNVIMIKPASQGYEDVPGIVIQGHMDMVAEKDSDCTKDMLKEGLDIKIEEGFVTAEKTTLGADDGIAVAMALALLSDDTLKHPRLEFICTVSEEVGMDGAAGIDLSMITGRRLINLDSEEEGKFIVGCAGGVTTKLRYNCSREEFSGTEIEIKIAECTGGHSGEEIDKGRANAAHLMNRILTAIFKETDIRIAAYEGGTKDNAIPRAAVAKIMVSDATSMVKAVFDKEAAAIKTEFAITDPMMEISFNSKEGIVGNVVQAKDSRKIIQMMNCIPNGVQTMSQDIKGLVETSLNLGIMGLSENTFSISVLMRSSVDSAKAALVRKLEIIAEIFDAEFEVHGVYPAWEFIRNSEFRENLIQVYKNKFGKEPIVETMHAGVECGLLVSKLPGLEVVSIGPDILDIHTPSERLSIESTARVYEYVRSVIEEK